MSTAAPVEQGRRFWQGSGDTLSPDNLVTQDQIEPFPQRWQFKPFTIAVYPEPTIEHSPLIEERPRDSLVDTAVEKFVDRLTAPDLDLRLMELRKEHLDKRRVRWREQVTRRLLDLAPIGLADRLIETPVGKRLAKVLLPSEFGESPRAVIRPGTGQLDLLLHPLDYAKMLDPKPFFFYVSAVEQLPEDYISSVDNEPHSADEFEFSRQQLVRAAAHNGVIFEMDRETEKITALWWLSTQGNHRVIRGSEEELLDSVAIRFCVHNGDTFVTDRLDYLQDEKDPLITWKEWSQHPIHHQLHDMAQSLNEMGLLDNHVELVEFTPDAPKHGKRITDAINRSDLGEGMYSAKVGKVMVVSPSGGGKVDYSPDPLDHHFTPISHITATGTVVSTPFGAPEEIKYANGSVESRENADARIMRQKYADGSVNSLAEYEQWQMKKLEKNQMMPIYQKGSPQEDFVIAHIHGMPVPEAVNDERVEIVEPDYQLYPKVDMACGSQGGNGALRSALAQSKWFTAPYEEGKHFLDERSIVVILRGHGILIFAKDPQAVVRAVQEDMVIKRPPELTV